MYKKAAGLVAEKGYGNVMTFKGGVPAWVKEGFPLTRAKDADKGKIASVTPDKLKEILETVQIVDIRDKSLYEMGWIPGSIKIPLALLSAEYKQILAGKPIVVVDHAGKQVLSAGRFLAKKGFADVQRLQGGLMAWTQKGYPMEK